MNKSLRKLFSLALALALVFSSGLGVGNITAQAEETTNTEFTDIANLTDAEKANIEFVVEREIMTGYEDDTFRPNGTLTRRHAAMVLARALDLELKDYEGTFEDVKENLGGKEIEALVRAGIVDGYPDGMFRPNAPLQRVHFAKLVANAYELEMGDKEVTHTDLDNLGTDKAFVELVLSNGIVDGYPDGTFGPRNEVKRIHVTKFMKNTIEFVESLESLELTVKSVSAIGAKKLQVTFNKEVEDTTKATFAVKRGSVAQNITGIEFNEDKTEAVITLTSKIVKGEYTVEVSGLTEEKLTSSVKTENEVITAVSFNSEEAVIYDDAVSTNTKDGLTFGVKFENQYGEDVSSTVTLSDVTISTSKGANPTLNKGVVTINNTADYTVGEKVVVTIVHKSTAKVATATLTVAQAATVSSIEAGEVTTTDLDYKGKEIFASSIQGNTAGYTVPLTIKDQYGNKLKSADLAGALTIVGSNNNIATPTITADANGYPQITLTRPSAANQTFGKLVVTVVSLTGVSTNVQIDVKENGKIDVLTVDQPAEELKQGITVDIPLTAVDQYGNSLTKVSELAHTPSGSVLTFTNGGSITFTNATVTTKTDYVNGNKLVVSITPAANAKNVIVTAISATGKVQNATWAVSDAPVPTAISGLESTFYKAVQIGQTTDIAKQINFVDQYGEEIALPAGYTVSYSAVDSAFDTFTNSGTQFTAATKGTEKVKVTLTNTNVSPNVIVDEFEFTLEAVQLADITEFGINDITKLYTGTTFNSGYDKAVSIYGLKGSTKVKVNPALVKTLTVDSGLTVTGTNTLRSSAVATNGADKTAVLSAVVEGANGPVVITKQVTFSDVAPALATIDVYVDGVKSTEPVIEISKTKFTDIAFTAGEANSTKTDFYVHAKDQYGVAALGTADTTTLSYTITNVKDADATDDLVVAVDNTTPAVPTITLTDAQNTVGDSFSLTITTKSGLVKTLKFIIID